MTPIRFVDIHDSHCTTDPGTKTLRTEGPNGAANRAVSKGDSGEQPPCGSATFFRAATSITAIASPTTNPASRMPDKDCGQTGRDDGRLSHATTVPLMGDGPSGQRGMSGTLLAQRPPVWRNDSSRHALACPGRRRHMVSVRMTGALERPSGSANNPCRRPEMRSCPKPPTISPSRWSASAWC
jgi:hypothetical protein